MNAPSAAAVSPTESPLRRWPHYLLMLVVPVVLAVGGGYGWHVMGLTVSTDNAYVQQDRVTLSPDVAGRIVEVLVHENQRVAAGDLLFRLDPTPFLIARAQAEAAIASARLKMAQLRAGYQESLAQLSSANEDLAFRGREYQRQASLARSGAATQSKLDTVRNDMMVAQQRVSALRQTADSARAALGGDPDIATDDHPMVREALARRDQAQFDLTHSSVTAPADGVASQTERLLVGQYVQVGTPVLSLVETGHSWIEANFKETELTEMRVGQGASVTLDAYPDSVLRARVDSIGAGTGSEFSLLPAQNATGNWVKVVQRVPVRLVLIDVPSDLPLRAGLSVSVVVKTHEAAP